MRTLWVVLVLLVATGCTTATEGSGPVRVNPLPAEVTGLGPAVFVTGEGLTALARFGDDIAGVAPVRQHAEVALGDPTIPTVVHGLGDDWGRDAILVGGRLTDTKLPEHSSADRVFRLGPGLSGTGSWCLTIRPDGRVAQPAVQVYCEAARNGGAYWSDGRSSWGGINLTTGAPTKAVTLPNYPVAASPDGRYLATVGERLIIADTTAGTTATTVDLPDESQPPGVFTKGGYAVVHDNQLSVVPPSGPPRKLLAQVSDAAFAADGRYAIVDDRSGLAVVDLHTGAVRRIADSATKRLRYLAVAGRQALVVDIDYRTLDQRGPASASVVDLTTARRQPVALKVPDASSGEVLDPVPGLASVQLRGGSEILTITQDGAVTLAPSDAVPYLALPGGRVLYRLGERDRGERDDVLVVADSRGGRTEIRTGASDDEVLGAPVVTGEHLILPLVPKRAGTDTNGETVLVRLDGTGKPLVLYRGAVLASLG